MIARSNLLEVVRPLCDTLKVCYRVSFIKKKKKSVFIYLFTHNFILNKVLWTNTKEHFYVGGCN